jgi:hypothetical protein
MNGRDQKESELTGILNYRDTSPDVFDVTKNEGFKKRVEIAASSKVFDMIGKIRSELFDQERYLPTSCSLRVELRYSNPEVCLDCNDTTKSYDFRVEKAQLYVRMHTVHPEILASHNHMFTKTKAKIPLKVMSANRDMIPIGAQVFNSDALLIGKLPTTVILGMVDAHQTWNRDPWNFQNFGLASITLSSDTDPALSRTIDVDFTGKNYLLGYNTLFSVPGLGNLGNNISRDDYASGYALYVFNLQDVFGDELHLIKNGYLRASLRFKNPITGNSILLIMLGITEELVELDDYRNVYFNGMLK